MVVSFWWNVGKWCVNYVLWGVIYEGGVNGMDKKWGRFIVCVRWFCV